MSTVAPETRQDHGQWPVCRCATPMHPQRLEERRGMKLERFVCPHRHWWNGFRHPYAWREARE